MKLSPHPYDIYLRYGDDRVHISLSDSFAHGFNKWCAAHDAGRKANSRAGADNITIADKDADDLVTTPPGGPHRPWLVPGVGTL